MLPEITKEKAIEYIEAGSGYWSPQCHTPTPGTGPVTVVYICGKFYAMPREQFEVKVHKVLHFEQSSMIVSHAIHCSNEELAEIMKVEMARIAEMTRRERWAQAFLGHLAADTAAKTTITSRQGRRWYNRFIVEPVDRGAPPDAN